MSYPSRSRGELPIAAFDWIISAQINVNESMGADHLAKKSGNFGLKTDGRVIFRKICRLPPEVLLFFVRNGKSEASCHLHKFRFKALF